MTLNAKGLINVIGNYDPKILDNLIHIYEENPYLAFMYFKEIYSFLKSLFIETNPIPIKELMNYLGYDVGRYRLPLCVMNEKNKKILIDELKKHKLT